jgi:lipid-A-disaccharide synthase
MRYYIIAGEASGDLHGAHLMKSLLAQDPHAEFRFWGGDAMSEIGGTPVRHIRELAIMGFIEVVMRLRTVLGNISLCKRDILSWKPDVVVGIDYPGFNLKIEKWAHEQGIKAVHYISPQLWAWKKGRLKGMRQYLDLLCYILPFEQRFYAENDMPQAVYVGHPLPEEIGEWRTANRERRLDEERPVIALLPGSRKQEL